MKFRAKPKWKKRKRGVRPWESSLHSHLTGKKLDRWLRDDLPGGFNLRRAVTLTGDSWDSVSEHITKGVHLKGAL